MSQSPRHPDHLANALEDLLVRHDLGQGLSDLGTLNRAWYRAAGDRWREGSWVLGLRGSELLVAVTSPAAASRLRFEAPTIAQRLRKAGWSSLKEIQVRVHPQQAQEKRSRSRRYSEEAAKGVAETAAEVSDPDLHAALQRLAGHLAPTDEKA